MTTSAFDEAGAPDIDIVDLEAEAGRQQHAERRLHPHQAGFLVGGLQDQNRDADAGAIFGNHALKQGALLVLCAGRGFAADLPVAMHGADRALRRGRHGRSRQARRACHDGKPGRSPRAPAEMCHGRASSLGRHPRPVV